LRVVKTPKLEPWELRLEVSYVSKILGKPLTKEKVKENLERMRYGVEESGGDTLIVQVPPYRADVKHVIDLVEDIAIAEGYDSFQPEIKVQPPTIGQEHPDEVVADAAREALIGLGYQEVTTFILTSRESQLDDINLSGVELVEVVNPTSREQAVCRRFLIPGLLQVFSRNKHHSLPQKIFEVGYVLLPDKKSETRTAERLHAAFAYQNPDASYSIIRSTLEAFLTSLGVCFSVFPSDHPTFIPGRVCKVLGEENSELGHFGEVHPLVLEKHKLENPVVVAEVDLTALKTKVVGGQTQDGV